MHAYRQYRYSGRDRRDVDEYQKTIYTIKSISLNGMAPVATADERAVPGKSMAGGGAGGVAPSIMNGAITFTVTVSVEFGF